MDTLFEKSYQKVEQTKTDFIRSLMFDIQWNNRMICIRGARGVGKTTLLFQSNRLQELHGISRKRRFFC